MDFLKRWWPAFVAVAVLATAGLLWWADTTKNERPNFGDLPTWLTFVAAGVGVPLVIIQFADQKKAIKEEFAKQQKRDELLDEQLAQVRAANNVLIRAQAEKIDLKFGTWPMRVPDGAGGFTEADPRYLARVVNGSSRPIRDVCCRLKQNPSALSDRPVEIGKYEAYSISGARGMDPKPGGDDVALLRSGEEYGFVFGALTTTAPDALMYVTFTDDAGTRWRISHDLHLQRDSEVGAFS